MNLIRKIVFAIEESTGELHCDNITVDGFTPEQIAYHCELLNDAGFVEANDDSHLGSPYTELSISRLTSAGHDFADAARNEAIWKKTMDKISKTVGGVTIEIMTAYLKTQIKELLGIGQS